MKLLRIMVIFLALASLGASLSLAEDREAAVTAKRFPAGYFLKYHKASVAQKQKVLAQLEAALQRLNEEGNGLIAKGTAIDRPGTQAKVYDRLAILDDSGLLIIARRVPNLYYGYQGAAPLNPNVYLVIKNPRGNVDDSFIRGTLVVEGDFVAFAHKFVEAIMEGLGGAAGREPEPPGRRQAK